MIKIQNLNLTLDQLLTHIPGHIYWMDKDNFFMGCNNEQAFNAGLNSRDEIIGKANYQMPWKEYAKKLDAINSEVIKTGAPKYLIEKIIINIYKILIVWLFCSNRCRGWSIGRCVSISVSISVIIVLLLVLFMFSLQKIFHSFIFVYGVLTHTPYTKFFSFLGFFSEN